MLAAMTQPAVVVGNAVAPQAATISRLKPVLRFDPVTFDAYVESARAQWGVPGLAIAAVRGDQILFMDAYGVRQLGKPQKVDTRTLFNVGSVTKSSTAAMLGTLAAEKKLAMTDRVGTYVPGLIAGEYADEITVADLLSHRSGLGAANYSIMGDISREEMVQRLRHLPRAAPIRTSFVYNNFGYVAAAAVAEKVTGSTWAT